MGRLTVRAELVIDGTGRPPIEKGAVVIDGERIVAVGKGERIGQESNAQVIDCSDQVLVPGLIDCHNHLSLDPTLEDYLHRVDDSDAVLALRASANMAIDLRAGVTTARCLGDRNFLDVKCKRGVESGLLTGPRLLVATRGIRAPHGYGFMGYPFDGPDQIRGAVRENLHAGADLIKLYITGTLPGSPEIHSYLSKEEISVAVQEAHAVGVKTAAHCIGGVGLQWCLEAGVDSIEHGYFMSDREIDMLAQSDSWLVLTPSAFLTEARMRTLPSELIDGHLRERDRASNRMVAAIRGGVKCAVGTDAMHGGLAQEIRYLVELGAPTTEALAAATRYGAIVCGLEGSIGTLEPGKSADIIGVRGNPVTDIRALGRVETVILQGKIQRTAKKVR
jgi:imidazolonepropionase-like amidohydrolase